MYGEYQDLLDQLPERCRKCPVLTRFAFLASNDRHTVEENMGFLQEELDSGVDPEHGLASSYIRLIDASTDRELASRKRLEQLSQLVTENCTGVRRGARSDDSTPMKVLAYLVNEKVCPNPDFLAVMDDPSIDNQLRMGNWDPPLFSD
jgi:hypothetical protein